jgi:hypothetical protein
MPSLKNLRHSFFLFPLSLLFFVTLMTGFNLSGSSVAVYGVTAGQSTGEAGLVMGHFRPIRSDEWLVRTPWLMSQIRNGLPTETGSGFGPIDAGVVGDLPTRSLDVLVRPHHLTSWFLSPDRALAAEWWMWHLLMMCGVYTFVVAISRHRGAGTLAALVLALSPSTQWWLAPGTFTTVGYGTLAGGLLVLAVQSSHRRQKFGLAILAGWSAACMISTLYVPWIITTAIVVTTAIAPALLHEVVSRPSRKDGLQAVGQAIGVMTVVCALLIATYVLRHSEAIRAIGETVYPGQRTSERGGTLNPATAFGSPFDYLASGPQTVNVNGTNQSENSSGILFVVPIATVFFGLLAAGRRFWNNREGRVLAGLLVGALVLVAWAFLPLPSYIGRLALLDRVPPGRLPPALSLVSAVTLGMFVSYLRNNNVRIPRTVVIVSVGVFGFIQLWAAGLYRVEVSAVNPSKPLMITVVLMAGFVLVCTQRWLLGASTFVAFGLFQAMSINPIQHGAESLLNNPVTQLIETVENSNTGDAGWLMLGGDVYVRGSIEATGVDFVSGISRYPNHATWEVLDPDHKYVDAWNRYAHLVVEAGPIGSAPVITSPQTDVVKVVLDPCDTRLGSIGVRTVITQDYQLTGCGRLLGETTWGTRVIRAYGI